MPVVDTKNRLKINKLVRNYFALSRDSYKLFRHRLLYERNIPEPFQKAIDKYGDGEGRIRFSLKGENLRQFDRGWKIFEDRFNFFQTYFRPASRNSYGITYEEFRSNKVVIGKQMVKLKKVLLSFYLENTKAAINSWRIAENLIHSLIKAKAFEKFEAFAFGGTESVFIDQINGMNSWVVSLESGQEVRVSINELDEKLIEKTIEKIIIRNFEIIGEAKISQNNKLEIVFSTNYADWFMASTKEDWTSCINLESDYHGAMWSGLPSLIADKSRFMVYITDGTKKEYKGIKVDRFINRVWGLYTRKKGVNDEYLYFFKSYPSFSFGVQEMFEQSILDNIKEFAPRLVGITRDTYDGMLSRYYAEALYNLSNVDRYYSLNKIFLDNSVGVKFASANKAKYFPYSYYYYKPFGEINSSTTVLFQGNPIGRSFYRSSPQYVDWNGFNCGLGLTGLIDTGYTLADYVARDSYELEQYQEDVGIA